jgi:hypothetical protein
MRPEGLFQWKIPMTPSGIEPATFRLVERCRNQLRHRSELKISRAVGKGSSCIAWSSGCLKTLPRGGWRLLRRHTILAADCSSFFRWNQQVWNVRRWVCREDQHSRFRGFCILPDEGSGASLWNGLCWSHETIKKSGVSMYVVFIYRHIYTGYVYNL